MKWFLSGIIFANIFFSLTVYANRFTQPVIKTNVVLKDISAEKCPTSWSSSGNAIVTENLSGFAIDTGTAVGVRSCIDCKLKVPLKDCLCETCYEYLN